jgi:hypothetical protein
MRNHSLTTACVYLALALCPVVAQGGSAPAGGGLPVLLPTLPPAPSLQGDVELQWWVINQGGGVSAADGLVLSGIVADPSQEPFAVLRGFDSPVQETGPPAEELLQLPVVELALAPVSPNPNRGEAQVSWSLPSESKVHLAIHDIQGREVEVLADGPYPAGRHQVTWRAGARGGEAAGIYFVRLQTPGRVLVRRMVVIR